MLIRLAGVVYCPIKICDDVPHDKTGVCEYCVWHCERMVPKGNCPVQAVNVRKRRDFFEEEPGFEPVITEAYEESSDA